MALVIEMIRKYGVKTLLWAALWRSEMKYVTVGWLFVAIAVIVSYLYITPLVGIGVAFVGCLGIQYIVHTYWHYEQMRDDDDFEYNPVAGAIIGTTLMYIICTVIVVVSVIIWGVISTVVGYPLTFPGVIGTWCLYAVYRWLR